MSTNRESTVAWIKSGFNAGHQDILDDMVAKETTLQRQASLEATDEESSSNYPEIGETGSYSSTSSASRYAEPFLEERKRVQFRVNTLRQAKRNKENNTNQRNEEEEEPPINILVFDGGGMKGKIIQFIYSIEMIEIDSRFILIMLNYFQSSVRVLLLMKLKKFQANWDMVKIGYLDLILLLDHRLEVFAVFLLLIQHLRK